MTGIRLRRLGRFARHPRHAVYRLFRARPLPAFLRRALQFPPRPALQRSLQELAAHHADHPLVLFPLPRSPWSYLFQRPHQLAAALARQGCLVLYATEPDPRFAVDFSVRGLHRCDERLYLYADGAAGATLAGLADRAVVWQYWPSQDTMINRTLRRAIVFYDCCDDVSLFPGSPAIVRRQHERSLTRAARVFASADELVRQIAPRRPDVVRLPNACDFEHFRSPESSNGSPLDAVCPPGKPVIGFCGAIAPWVDVDLLLAAAAMRPEYEFVLIGEDQIGLTHSRRASTAPNVTVLPAIEYRALPQAVARFDVAVIPFQVNRITRAAGPIKLFEYLAAGKPVVSTDLPECRACKHVQIATGPDGFASALDRALATAGHADVRQRLQAFARVNTWSDRATVIRREIAALADARSRP